MTPSRSDIPIGYENAISREALAAKWGVSDRAARRIIERMRDEETEEPYIIASTAHQSGYWRTNKLAELDRYEREVIARAGTQFKRLQAVSAVRQRVSGQMRMEL
jgi:hypothetical protein